MLGANHVLVGPMRRDELRRAIELPAQRAGLRVDPELVDALIADVEGEPGALPLLSTALLELWQQRDGRAPAPCRLRARRRRPRRRGAAGRARLRASSTPEQRPVARTILLRLAGVGDEGEASCAGGVPLAELERTPERRRGARRARRRPARDRQPATRPRSPTRRCCASGRGCASWLEEDAEGRRLHHHLGRRGARVGRARPRPRRALPRRAAGRRARLGGRPRPGARRRRARLPRREPRRRRPARSAACAPCSPASRRCSCSRSSPGVVALEQRGSARDAGDRRRRAAARRARARRERPRPLAAARAPGRRARRQRRRRAATCSPRCSGARPRSACMRGVGERISALALSPDGRTLAVGDLAGNLFLFDTRTRRRVTAPEPQPGDWSIAHSPSARTAASSRSRTTPPTGTSSRSWTLAPAALDSGSKPTNTGAGSPPCVSPRDRARHRQQPARPDDRPALHRGAIRARQRATRAGSAHARPAALAAARHA